ncbi:MAG TPA: hypothetical protein VGI81_14590 [Tepidisphaeraceae bacterium]|jgi:hypothetical protein
MDQELFDLLKPEGVLAKLPLNKTPKPHELDAATGEIIVDQAGEERRYAIKPLSDLYGPGHDVDTVDPQDDRFMPLFLAIEEAIVRHWEQDNPGLTDGTVALTLDQLGMGPDSTTQDPLAQRIQLQLRLCLSMNDYSRQEVKAALKKVGKSVDRHTRAGGPRAYLNFIAQFFGKRR